MQELSTIRTGFFWLLFSGFVFGISDRVLATIREPIATNLGLLTISTLCFALFLFLRPVRID